jgi:hypothetical protein
LGFTLSYSVNNGIDQEETITPLLWRIYYDPLISYIHTNSIEYSPKVFWLSNPKNKTYNKTQAKCSVLAYIDNTMRIVLSQEQLTSILNITESFYSMANIQVNSTKLILTTNNHLSLYSPIVFNNHTLLLHSSKILFKFLGY